MNFKKILAAVAAAVMSVGIMATTAMAADSYNAVLGFADSAWAAQDWETAVEVTGDGTYTISSDLVNGAVDFGVFVIDIQEMFAKAPEATAVLDSVKIAGTEVPFDASKIVYGDIEEKGNYRIEIYNQFGDTKNDPPVTAATPVTGTLEITFTVSGLSAPAAGTDAAGGANTGVAPVAALAVATLAGAALVATKKR